MTTIAIIGSGPTGIYALKGLIESESPLSITVYEANADPGKGTPYHPNANDPAMLANIASIELPPVCVTLTEWLRQKTPAELSLLGLSADAIGDREFYPRIVLGEYYQAQFRRLAQIATERGHVLEVKARHRVTDIALQTHDIRLQSMGPGGREDPIFDHVVMATGHDWPEHTEIRPGYFISPWPAANLATIGDGVVGILGTSLSAIDAVVSVATMQGMFLRDEAGSLEYRTSLGPAFHLTMMSRKGLLPEADFYCPVPYEPLSIFTAEAVERLVQTAGPRLLDEIFALFQAQLHASDPAYAGAIGLGLQSVETIADAYFRERDSHDPFTWAAMNLAQAQANKRERRTVPWRYAILRMHETLLRAVPFFNKDDLKRFHKYFKAIFVDDYATVPHQSIERLLALHRAGRLSVLKLGGDYQLDNQGIDRGAAVTVDGTTHRFDAFIDATGQSAVSADDLPFPSLVAQGVVRKATAEDTAIIMQADGDVDLVPTGGIDLDDQFRPRFEQPLSRNLYCISIPFLLHKLPFVQGITSARDLGVMVAKAVLENVELNHLKGSSMLALPSTLT